MDGIMERALIAPRRGFNPSIRPKNADPLMIELLLDKAQCEPNDMCSFRYSTWQLFLGGIARDAAIIKGNEIVEKRVQDIFCLLVARAADLEAKVSGYVLNDPEIPRMRFVRQIPGHEPGREVTITDIIELVFSPIRQKEIKEFISAHKEKATWQSRLLSFSFWSLLARHRYPRISES